MLTSLIAPFRTFQSLLASLARDHTPIVMPLGQNTMAGEWLLRSAARGPATFEERGQHWIRVVPVAPGASQPSPGPFSGQGTDQVVGHFFLGTGPRRGEAFGWIRLGTALVPFSELSLIGPGMHRLNLEPGKPSAVLLGPIQRWSRTILALGGEAPWRRLVGLRVAIVGCGRTGSLVAFTLARLGVHRMTLIDPDVVELHNVGEMDGVDPGDVGHLKVDAVGRHLQRWFPFVRDYLVGVPYPITDARALASAKRCDVLIVAGDNDAVRILCALVATTHCKILVDIGSGILGTDSPSQRSIGADVRLIVPGDGCLLCRGSVAQYRQALGDLSVLTNSAPNRSSNPAPLRNGSLRTLNQIAAGLAVHMLQDLVVERLKRSTWAHLEFDAEGRLAVRYPDPEVAETRTNCPLCARLGEGDLVV